jgi:peptidoglycan/xylan/chitin deacetylase (PgdA/CDA1 family)
MLAEGRRYADQPGLMSHQAFGPMVGVPRILEILRQEDVRATFFVPGVTAERYPDVVRRVLAEGHEVGHHSHSHRPALELTELEQREDFERGMEALARAGARPVGHRSALWAATWETASIALEFGMEYESNFMDNDRPYVLETSRGPIVEVPPHWSWDDFPQYAYLWDPDVGKNVAPPSHAVRVWVEELEAMRDWGAALVLNAHPFLSGRASRVAAIRHLIRCAKEWGDVAVLTAAELARRAAADPAVQRRRHERLTLDPTVYPHH